ncbi:MAG TPA: YceI family protein, partial [Hellea balneolensis]|nr:YceI family protein [Hellea balneolensis]
MRYSVRNIVMVSMLVLGACSGDQAVPPSSAQDAAKVEVEKTGPWNLINGQSSISFITTKKGTVSEVHTFKEFSGSARADGKTSVLIALDSVETNIDIRNERMREHLFETAKYPDVKIGAQIKLDVFSDLALGERRPSKGAFNVEMHGLSKDYEADMWITRLTANKVLVESRAPVFVKAEDFALQGGIDKLQELAKL